MSQNKHRGFMDYTRELAPDAPIAERLKHYQEFANSLPPDKLQQQALRCMNCGIPFCHEGCPLGNQIPDFNELVKDDDWQAALENLHSTNNFPEFTGRVCPAPCEGSCVLGINEPPVAIEMIEREIGDRGWQEGWIKPQPPGARTGKRVAVVGSGPAGLAAAQQLNRAGHSVVVYERDDEPGGLLTYGIPAFKLDKEVVFRRIQQIKDEGVEIRCNAWVGRNVPASELDGYDAVLITIGSTKPRTLDIPGVDLKGIHLAMDFLPQQTRRVLGKPEAEAPILATGKRVIVLGGGDTGSDCVGTSLRQGCKSLLNIELMPKPPIARDPANPWPEWPFILRTSSSHEEGGERAWSVLTKRFEGDADGNVTALHATRIEWSEPDAQGRRQMIEIEGGEMRFECDLALLALGFVQPETDTFVTELGLELERNRFGQAIKADEQYRTSRPCYYAAGDARRGQSLVVWAIAEGREAARTIDLDLMGRSDLPARGSHGYESVQPAILAGH